MIEFCILCNGKYRYMNVKQEVDKCLVKYSLKIIEQIENADSIIIVIGR